MDRTACTELQCLYKGALYLYFFLSSIPFLHCFPCPSDGTDWNTAATCVRAWKLHFRWKRRKDIWNSATVTHITCPVWTAQWHTWRHDVINSLALDGISFKDYENRRAISRNTCGSTCTLHGGYGGSRGTHQIIINLDTRWIKYR